MALVEDAIYEGGLSFAEAKRSSPFELIQAIEGARYRQMRADDGVLFGAYLLVRTWLGTKAPRIDKVRGRLSAAKFKEACLGRTPKETASIKAQFERLKNRVEAKHGKR